MTYMTPPTRRILGMVEVLAILLLQAAGQVDLFGGKVWDPSPKLDRSRGVIGQPRSFAPRS